MRLPDLHLRSSWGVDSFERAVVLAALLLQQASPQCRLVPEEDGIAIAASFPLASQAEAVANLTESVGLLSVEDPPAVVATAEPTPEVPYTLPSEPDFVTTVESYFVWCSQHLGLAIHLGERLLVQGRIPYDRSLWLVTRNLIRAVTTAKPSVCLVEEPVLVLMGAGAFEIVAPIPGEAAFVGRGSLRAESIRASNANLLGEGEADFEAGVWLESGLEGYGDLTAIPPVGAAAKLVGFGFLIIPEGLSFSSYGSGRASFGDGLISAEIFGSGELELSPNFGSLWLPWVGQGWLIVDAADPGAELIGIGFLPDVTPGQILSLSTQSEFFGKGEFNADPYLWPESELVGEGELFSDSELIAADFFGDGFLEAGAAALVRLFGSGYFSGDPVTHLETEIIGSSSCEGVQFGNQEANLLGTSLVDASAALSSNIFLIGDGFFSTQSEEVLVCRVPCGVVTAGPLVFVNLDLGSAQEVA